MELPGTVAEEEVEEAGKVVLSAMTDLETVAVAAVRAVAVARMAVAPRAAEVHLEFFLSAPPAKFREISFIPAREVAVAPVATVGWAVEAAVLERAQPFVLAKSVPVGMEGAAVMGVRLVLVRVAPAVRPSEFFRYRIVRPSTAIRYSCNQPEAADPAAQTRFSARPRRVRQEFHQVNTHSNRGMTSAGLR